MFSVLFAQLSRHTDELYKLKKTCIIQNGLTGVRKIWISVIHSFKPHCIS